MKKTSIRCRNCGEVMTSKDARFECRKCGYRYIIDTVHGIIIEPKRQQPKGTPDVSLAHLTEE